MNIFEKIIIFIVKNIFALFGVGIRRDGCRIRFEKVKRGMFLPDEFGLKEEVKRFWNLNPCNAQASEKKPFTKEYYDELESVRYTYEPYVWSFAQFSRYRGKKVLEIGVGTGSDFIQWVRSGCIAVGCDITEAAVEHTKKHLETNGLKADVLKEDCEKLSFEDESFDLIYSFGVIHHTPDTKKAVSEIYRVLKRGGTAKVMVYNRNSWPVFFKKLKNPHQCIDEIMYHGMESLGTKVFSIEQARELFSNFSRIEIAGQLTPYELAEAPACMRRVLWPLVRLLGNMFGWNLLITAIK